MFRKACLWLIAAAVIAVTAFGAWAQEKVYINGIDANFPPFAFVDKNGVPLVPDKTGSEVPGRHPEQCRAGDFAVLGGRGRRAKARLEEA